MAKRRKKRATQRGKAVSLATLPEKVARPLTRGDMGPDTQLQRAGTVLEPVTFIMDDGTVKESPNGIKRLRRIDLVESYHRRDRNPLLNARQYKAATAIRVAYEATMKSAPAIKKVQVDSTPKPDAHVAIMIDRVSNFARIMKHVPADSKAVVDAVVLENQSIGWLRQYRGSKHALGVRLLQAGLDAVADALGM